VAGIATARAGEAVEGAELEAENKAAAEAGNTPKPGFRT
jgi:hypothetical protein